MECVAAGEHLQLLICSIVTRLHDIRQANWTLFGLGEVGAVRLRHRNDSTFTLGQSPSFSHTLISPCALLLLLHCEMVSHSFFPFQL